MLHVKAQKYIAIVLLFLTVSGAKITVCFAANAPQFFSTIADLPLMPGFREQADKATVFSKAQGRIVKTQAVGTATPKQAQHFYLVTLPNLGWVYQGGKRFVRADEEMILDFSKAAAQTIIHITLTPKLNKG